MPKALPFLGLAWLYMTGTSPGVFTVCLATELSVQIKCTRDGLVGEQAQDPAHRVNRMPLQSPALPSGVKPSV